MNSTRTVLLHRDRTPWIRGVGCVPIYVLIEDVATADKALGGKL
ncbi:hypothetical protein [Photobacterium alginatilyticum]|uniref:Malate synthase C-terminal domain-containing protein n=1 Tax=Photobacterium alginatilyticum TaxID=1775171 RepID=A0ABW9YBW5_9GAMM|nr:hypothetical protein [Photobacterium alginatilyticum]